MSHSTSNKSKLRFAAFIRVSTEKQEQEGESLKVQEKQIVNAVKSIGGTIVKRYGGQEHATAGFEREQLEQLLTDAAKKPRPFDAVIVADESRWSRDNAKSKQSLEILRQNSIRFFVGTTEHDLMNPQARLWLGIAAEMHEYQAQIQSKKSIESRIKRASEGKPSSGKLPFGRTYDAKTGDWDIVPEKQQLIKTVADRYLGGESMAAIAKELGLNHANLHKVLMHRSGSTWESRFRSKANQINEMVTFTIPPLLSEKTIKALHDRARDNKTYSHGHLKNKYLLARKIFCSHCGYAMFGQTNHASRRYYRHAHHDRDRKCTATKSWVDADVIEENVLRRLFLMFGNAALIEQAIMDAIPNREQVQKQTKRVAELNQLIAKQEAAKARFFKQLEWDTITEDDFAKQMKSITQNINRYSTERQQLEKTLADSPSAEQITHTVNRVQRGARIRYADIRVATAKRSRYEQMTYEEKQALVQKVFGGQYRDSKGQEQRMGVRIEWPKDVKPGQEKWRFSMRGFLVDLADQAVLEPNDFIGDDGGDINMYFGKTSKRAKRLAKKIINGVVTKSALHSPCGNSYSLPFALGFDDPVAPGSWANRPTNPAKPQRRPTKRGLTPTLSP